MESLTGQEIVMAPDQAEGGHKTPKSPDRIALTESESKKVEAWLVQIKAASKGYLNVSRSDVVNFLIREHRDLLLGSEIKRVRADHYDPIRHIQWIMPQIKLALTQGDHVRVADLQAELRAVELSVITEPSGDPSPTPVEPKKRQRRRQKTDLLQEGVESKNSKFTE